jgi:hypothetical protein
MHFVPDCTRLQALVLVEHWCNGPDAFTVDIFLNDDSAKIAQRVFLCQDELLDALESRHFTRWRLSTRCMVVAMVAVSPLSLETHP